MRFRNLITALDYHHGQASRTIVSGYPPIRGRTMAEKSRYFEEHLGWLGRCLCREPRGHANMLGSILTDPVSPEAVAGVLFLHPGGQFAMCGDSAFATAFALLENGVVEPRTPETTFALDTPAGLVWVRAEVTDGVVREVTLKNVPSFAAGEHRVQAEGVGDVTVEVAYGGLFYALVEARQLGLSLTMENAPRIRALGAAVLAAAQSQVAVHHPEEARPQTVSLCTFYEPRGEEGLHFRVANVYGPANLGRTPSGTGTSALMALRHAQGRLALGQEYVQESLLGVRWRARLVEQVQLGEIDAVVPEISAKSHLMGIHQFVVDSEDPFPEGFDLAAS